jgi:hypothetical protein
MSSKSKEIIDGDEVLDDVAMSLGIDLIALVAGSSYWAPCTEDIKAPVRPEVRRAKRGEGHGKMPNGAVLDDNTIANEKFKRALSHLGKFRGFTVCHIWPGTTYDTRYHTVLANLVLLPRSLSSLTDHHDGIAKCLQYRSWELYRWHPDGKEQPSKPEGYPENWRPPSQPKAAAGRRSAGKLRLISIVPADKNEFCKEFMKRGKATITVHYFDGRVEKITWEKMRFSDTSDPLNNLRSRKMFRKDKWQESGIEKVEARVEGDEPKGSLTPKLDL